MGNVFKSIYSRLEGKSDEKVRVFVSAVKALADKIDDL